MVVPRLIVTSNTDLTDTDERIGDQSLSNHKIVHQSTARDENETANIRNGHEY